MFDKTAIELVLERSERILEGTFVPERAIQFTSYAISNFRGGIGKSTLSFNLAYELSRRDSVLLLDTCSQRNFSQNIFGDNLSDFSETLYDALVVGVTGAGSADVANIINSVRAYCPSFAGNQPSYMIPGSKELFLFPSLLYSQLAQFAQIAGGNHSKITSLKVLTSLKEIIEKAQVQTKAKKVLVDTSPFFAGATHLAWCSVEALIIPVRVDQHSVESLKLTLDMLTNPVMDFHKFNSQAGIHHQPKVHAVVMTHCGWNRQKANTPDSSTRYFVERAIDIASKYPSVFTEEDISKCFYLLDDFHSSGRISGKQRIPLAKLRSGQKYTVEGQRLEVNPSVDRYKLELVNLAAAL